MLVHLLMQGGSGVIIGAHVRSALHEPTRTVNDDYQRQGSRSRGLSTVLRSDFPIEGGRGREFLKRI